MNDDSNDDDYMFPFLYERTRVASFKTFFLLYIIYITHRKREEIFF